MNQTDETLAFAKDSIEHEGTTYPLTPPTYGTATDYVSHIVKEAIQALVRNREAYGKEFDNQMLRMGRDVGTKLYGWGQQLCRQSLLDPENQMQLCFLVMKQSTPLSWEKFRAIWNTDAKYVNPDTNEEEDGCMGDVMFLKIAAFLKRPNGFRPDLLGTGKNAVQPSPNSKSSTS